MVQLPESNIPAPARIVRLVELARAGCTGVELGADIQVAISVLPVG